MHPYISVVQVTNFISFLVYSKPVVSSLISVDPTTVVF